MWNTAREIEAATQPLSQSAFNQAKPGGVTFGGLDGGEMWIGMKYDLLAGAITILKNDGVRQWEGWQPIYEMENSTCSKPPTSYSSWDYKPL